MDLQALATRAEQLRQALGDDLLMLVHHYQRPEIVALADHVGDSFVLARHAASSKASRIVFCGVWFMGEAAAILARPGQKVYLPDPKAGCPMADMADLHDARHALDTISRWVAPARVIPITYINSNADVKALVGERGGIVCTSANARRALEWALHRGDLVFFLPDEMLARNTAIALGLGDPPVWNPHTPSNAVTPEQLRSSRVVAWKGYCHVHTQFSVEQIQQARANWPDARIVVHPECHPEVVKAADLSGSTGLIVDTARELGPGKTLVVGTEVSLVNRLAAAFPDRRIVPLSYSLCPNMYRTNLAKVVRLLESFEPELEVTVPPEVAASARLALARMLDL